MTVLEIILLVIVVGLALLLCAAVWVLGTLASIINPWRR